MDGKPDAYDAYRAGATKIIEITIFKLVKYFFDVSLPK